jgi:hypothetical protein
MPCYALLDKLDAPTYLKIKRRMEEAVGQALYYLNDFYIYTDATSKTDWHVDTELFSFESAINAWILLSPERVSNPIGVLDGMNDTDDRYYHSATREGDGLKFAEYGTRRTTVRSLSEIDSQVIVTPEIEVGDILLLNPRRFHRTNVDLPKHSFSIKFVVQGELGFLAKRQVPAVFWPEVALFNQLVEGAQRWEDVLSGLQRALETESGRKQLSDGFYPAKFELYRAMAQSL